MNLVLVAWTLVVVTYGGDVTFNKVPTKRMCDEGRSMALTGKTLEQVAAAHEASKRWEQAQADKWRKAHPPRQPKDAHERELLKPVLDSDGKPSLTTWISYWGDTLDPVPAPCGATNPGMICDIDPMKYGASTYTESAHDRDDTKVAECVQ